jgi:hypothetical protein
MGKVIEKVNPSTTQPSGWDLLRVDPERRFSTPSSKSGLGAVERVKIVNLFEQSNSLIPNPMSPEMPMVEILGEG